MTALCGAVMEKSCQADADGYVTLYSEECRLKRQNNFGYEDVCRTDAGSCVVV